MSDSNLQSAPAAAENDVMLNSLLEDLLHQWEDNGLEAVAPLDEAPEAVFRDDGSQAEPEPEPAYAEAVAGPPPELFDPVLTRAMDTLETLEQTGLAAAAAQPEPEPAPVLPATQPAPTRRESLLKLLAAMYPEVATQITGSAAVDTGLQKDRAGKEPFVVFHIAEENFAVALHQVLEADRLPAVTPVPFVPDYVRGVTNRRGEVLPLIDLRLLLGLDVVPAQQEGRGRMLVVRRRESEPPTAIVVDGLGGIAWMDRGPGFDAPGPVASRIGELLAGAGRHRDTTVHILDVDRLFTSKQLA